MSSLFTAFRDWRRARYADRHAQANGDRYSVHGLEVQVPQSVDPGVRYLLAKGRPYEAEEAHFIQKALGPGVPVIELGGSLGVVSAVIRRQIGPDAPHIVVEANPDLVAVCRGNAGPAQIVQGAVAYTDAPSIAFARGRNAHEGKLAEAGAQDTFEAPVLRLADLVVQMPDGPWALVSDIEGAELPMFEHEPAETFARLSYAVIEIHPRVFAQMGSSEDAFLSLCHAKGLEQVERRADVILFKGPVN